MNKIAKMLKERLYDAVEEHGLTGVECYAECKYSIPADGKPDDYYQHDFDTLMVCSLDKILHGHEGQCDNFDLLKSFGQHQALKFLKPGQIEEVNNNHEKDWKNWARCTVYYTDK